MDNAKSNCDLAVNTTTIGGEDSVERDVLTLVASFKGRATLIEPSSKSLWITERTPETTLKLEGFWPCIEYLEERYPSPTVYLDTPVRRGIIRSLGSTLLRQGEDGLVFFEEAQTRFLAGHAITLIDFIVYAINKKRRLSSFWARHAARVEEAFGELDNFEGTNDE